MKRVIAAFNVPDDWDTGQLADLIEWSLTGTFRGDEGPEAAAFETFDAIDPTVWEWSGFWSDVKDGVVTTDGDKTRRPS